MAFGYARQARLTMGALTLPQVAAHSPLVVTNCAIISSKTVDVVSVTQPTGDDPSQELMRQIIGIFDEYTSRENGKNVIRAMRESAKQGFWNGTTPPLGYRIVEAERRGSKVKKRLEVDPVDAELVRLIFRLYAEGDGCSGPLGVKETTKWLNQHGYRA